MIAETPAQVVQADQCMVLLEQMRANVRADETRRIGGHNL